MLSNCLPKKVVMCVESLLKHQIKVNAERVIGGLAPLI